MGEILRMPPRLHLDASARRGRTLSWRSSFAGRIALIAFVFFFAAPPDELNPAAQKGHDFGSGFGFREDPIGYGRCDGHLDVGAGIGTEETSIGSLVEFMNSVAHLVGANRAAAPSGEFTFQRRELARKLAFIGDPSEFPDAPSL